MSRKVSSAPPASAEVLSHRKMQWVKLTARDTGVCAWLEEQYHFHPLDIHGLLNAPQRPRFEDHGSYFYLVLNFPIYNEKTRKITSSRVDFFISEIFLISLHDPELGLLEATFRSCLQDPAVRDQYLQRGIGFLVYRLLSDLLVAAMPVVDLLARHTAAIERELFAGRERSVLQEVLMVKQNISEFRFIMQAHKITIRKFMALSGRFFTDSQLNVYLQDLIEEIKELWDTVDNLRETVAAIHDTNTSLLSYHLNETMKFLTLISVLLLPASVIAAILGMNVVSFPFYPSGRIDFWPAFLVIATVECCFLAYFKWRKVI